MNITHPRRATAFTLVEVMIVVIIIGILAAIALPQFNKTTERAATTAIQMNLTKIRSQIEVYRSQHNSTAPTLANIVNQLTAASKVDGTTAAIGTNGYPFGPYMLRIPNNDHTDTNDISSGAIGSSAWYYDQATGNFNANDSAETFAY